MPHDPEVIDSYLTAEVHLPRGDMMKLGKVVGDLLMKITFPLEKQTTILSLIHVNM
jgi:hypothetical protein